MMPWLAPLVYVGIMGALWLFAPEGARERVRGGLARDINLYMICALVIVVFGVAGTLNWRVTWVDYMAWLLAGGLGVFSVVKLLKHGRVPEDDRDSIDRL